MADDGWEVRLEPAIQLEPAPSADRSAPLRDGAPVAVRGCALVLLLTAAWIFASVAIPADLEGEQAEAQRRAALVPAIVGRALPVPATFRVPPGLGTTTDGSYLALYVDHGQGRVLVTTPTQVADTPNRFSAMPDDPASWLQQHPRLFVTRVRTVPVAGRDAVQVDYQLSQEAARIAGMRTLSVPLFCGWRAHTSVAGGNRPPCTRITSRARVRATFVPVLGQTLMVEAIWPVPDGASPRIPDQVARSYAALLKGVTLRERAGASVMAPRPTV